MDKIERKLKRTDIQIRKRVYTLSKLAGDDRHIIELGDSESI
jgi:hypothetical protein